MVLRSLRVPSPVKTLYIIDGYAQFFRAYHAIRTPMTSPVTREPTNMTFGFIGMLLKLLRGDAPNMVAAGGPPDYVVVALDVSGDRGTFRSQIYPEYKATRPEPPDDLKPQVERCLATLEALGVPVIGAEGYEADDVIASLAAKLREKHPDLLIRIISNDKDLKQILEGGAAAGSGVEIYDIYKDLVFDVTALKADTGLDPSQVIDMLALMGDTSDNVPGVPGIGPKTAAQLIAEHGSLDAVIAAADRIKGKRGESIKASASLLPMSKQLVTLHRDLPVDLDLASAESRRIALSRLSPILKELGFNRYQDELKALLAARGESGSPASTTSVLRQSSATSPAPTATATPRAATRLVDEGGLFADYTPDDRAAPVVAEEYRCVRTADELAEVVRQIRHTGAVSVDTETTGLSPLLSKICGVSLAVSPGQGWYVPIRSPEPSTHLSERDVLDGLRPVLEDPAIVKFGHNLKFDMLVLRNAGVELRGLCPPPHPDFVGCHRSGWPCGTRVGDAPITSPHKADATAPRQRDDRDMQPCGCDSMVASFLIDAGRSSHSLDALALAILKRTNISIKELIGSGKTQRTFDQVPLDLATPYAAEDADVALRLCQHMQPQLRAMGLDFLARNVELPLVEVLAELEWNGILADPVELDRQRHALERRIRELAARIQDEAMVACGRTFDPDSPKQLASILFNKPTDAEPGLGLASGRRTKTGRSTDAEVLEKLAADPGVTSQIPTLILDYRQLTKLVSTYLVALRDAINPRTGRIHASFHQTVAATGRLASSDPNLQNIPIRTDIGRDIRKAFLAPPGRVLITADYSQIELRLLAHLSRDQALCEAFERGEDIHAAVAAQIHNVPLDKVTRDQRSGAKMVNFGIVYGITPFGLARRLGISNTAAEEIITSYKKRFAGITTFLEECIAQARRFGYVETMLKRRRPIDDIDSNNPQRRALAERIAINSVVQGSAADLIKIAMVDLHARLSPHASHWRGRQPDGEYKPPEIPGVLMLLQIHDELVFEAPEASAEAARALIVDRMEKAMSLRVPLIADAHIARTWYEGK